VGISNIVLSFVIISCSFFS